MNRLPLLIGLLAACNGGEPQDQTTWTEAAPVLEQHCVSCHQEGGIGPFRLDTYDEASQWGSAMVAATSARSMPPFLVTGDGTCGDFQDNHWLSDEELATLAGWVEAETPEGDGYDISLSDPPALDGEAATQTLPEFVPEIVGGDYAEFDEYRCFMVDPGLTEDAFLTAYEVVPGNDAIVHHVIGMPVDLDEEGWDDRTPNRDVIAGLRAAQPDRDGWPCFEGAGEGVSFDGEVVTWAPGQGAVLYPEGVGLKVSAGTQMVYQVHYNLADPATIGQSDQTAIKLKLEDDVEREAYITLPDLFLGGGANVSEIPPGEADAKVTFELPVRWLIGDIPLDFELIGVLPHMHERGRTMRIGFDRDEGGETCVADVQAWDFNWQRMYLYETPIVFDSGDTLTVECGYDTTGDTEPTTPGWGTRNEMCLPGLLVTLAR